MIEQYINQVIHGDCLEAMKTFPDNCCNLVITDPPYKAEDIEGDYWELIDGLVEQSKRIASDYLIMFNNMSRLYDLMFRYGRPHRILMWTKGVVKYAYRCEPILVYAINPSFKINKLIFSDHLPFAPLHKNQSCHRYEKPLRLMENIVRYTPEGSIICDPFCGSGTTLKAAKLLGRGYIGIDIDQRNVDISNEKLAQIEMGI